MNHRQGKEESTTVMHREWPRRTGSFSNAYGTTLRTAGSQAALPALLCLLV